MHSPIGIKCGYPPGCLIHICIYHMQLVLTMSGNVQGLKAAYVTAVLLYKGTITFQLTANDCFAKEEYDVVVEMGQGEQRAKLWLYSGVSLGSEIGYCLNALWFLSHGL